MTHGARPALDVDFVVAYPREAEVGERHLLTVDLRVNGGSWPYGRDEEYPLECIVDASPGFSCRSLGGASVVLHKFGGTYGPAEFLLTAAEPVKNGRIRVTLVNRAGVPVKVLKFKDVNVAAAGTGKKNISATPMVRVRKPDEPEPAGAMNPELRRLLDRPFGLLLGDRIEDNAALRDRLAQQLRERDDKGAWGSRPLTTIAQRFEMRFGRDHLLRETRSFLISLLERVPPIPPFINAIARRLPPGVHISLSWMPWLELAITSFHPDKAVHALLPALANTTHVYRAAGSKDWHVVESTDFDTDEEFVVLRPYGGLGPDWDFVDGRFTEDDHDMDTYYSNSSYVERDRLAAREHASSALLVGVSWTDERHKRLLRWLFRDRDPPKGSVLVGDGLYGGEYNEWARRGVAVVRQSIEDLTTQLEMLEPRREQ